MIKLIAAIIALAKVIPVIDKWLEKLFDAYVVYKSEKSKAETKIEIDRAIENQDQRRMESENHSGVYSGHGDIRTSLPGVMRDKKPD